MKTRTWKLSNKNANWIYPAAIDVGKLKDGHNKDLHNEIVNIIIQPIGNVRRTVVVLTQEDARRLSYKLMKILADEK